MMHNKFSKTYQLKTKPIYYFTVSVGLESMHISLVLIKAPMKCELGLIWKLDWGRVGFQNHLYFLEVVGIMVDIFLKASHDGEQERENPEEVCQ